jgi:hypothetical protein
VELAVAFENQESLGFAVFEIVRQILMARFLSGGPIGGAFLRPPALRVVDD